MADYIVCHKKRNAPRLSIRICQKKCTSKNDCKHYLATLKMPAAPEQGPVSESVPAGPVAP
jgi:hypothetical protein